MKAAIIVLENHPVSEIGFKKLRESSERVGNQFEGERFDAVTPDRALSVLADLGLTWNFPMTGEVLDPETGLRKRAYSGKDPRARIACFCSHYMLWQKCAAAQEPILILEHDALFMSRFTPEDERFSLGFTSINDPRGATRKGNLYHRELKARWSEHLGSVVPVSLVDLGDDPNVPHGLPGNSAYVVHPAAAIAAMSRAEKYGAWPNDALVCHQLLPGKLYASPFYRTTIQNLPSTTS